MKKASGSTFYLVRCSTGETYGKNGSFGSGSPQTYKRVKSATECADRLARYYRFDVRVDDQDGNEIYRATVPKDGRP